MELFDTAAARLEQHTDFDRLEARGTLRIALKEAGLDPKSLTLDQLRVVFETLMPPHLETRAVANAVEVCRVVIAELAESGVSERGRVNNADAIFSRLGGDQA